MKACTKCGQSKLAIPKYFCVDRRAKSGLRAQCRECERKQNKAWRVAHPDKYREQKRRWRKTENGKASLRKQARKRYWANIEKNRANNRKHNRKYAITPKGKERGKRYHSSQIGHEANKRYRRSQKGRETRKHSPSRKKYEQGKRQEAIRQLSDWYVRKELRKRGVTPKPELIEIGREQISLRRTLRELRRIRNESNPEDA